MVMLKLESPPGTMEWLDLSGFLGLELVVCVGDRLNMGWLRVGAHTRLEVVEDSEAEWF